MFIIFFAQMYNNMFIFQYLQYKHLVSCLRAPEWRPCWTSCSHCPRDPPAPPPATAPPPASQHHHHWPSPSSSSSSSSSSLGQSRLSGIVGPGNSSSGYILECSQHLQQNSRLKTIESNDQYEPIIKDQLKGTIHNNS